MKLRKSLLTFALGVGGGFLAFLVMNFVAENSQKQTEIEIATPADAVHQVAYNVNRTPAPALSGTIDLREAASMTVPAVVHVKTVQMGKEYVGSLRDFFYGIAPRLQEVPQRMGIGSGVIISDDGYIITNNHVIDKSDDITITLNNKREYKATVIGTDPNTDIALLKIDEKNLPYLKYGNSDDVDLGEWVLAVGNPYDLTSTVTAGIISAKARDLGINREKMSVESFLQTDAAINSGNSGGALVNSRGELIGINTAIGSPTGNFSGYAFAVPINIATKVVNDLKEFGTVQRAMIGIRMGELTSELAKELKIDEVGGIYIGEVIEGGAAKKAGLKEGDIIKRLNGYSVNTLAEFQGQLGKYSPGTTVGVSVLRDGKEYNFELLLQNSFGEISLITDNSETILGAKVESLTRAEMARYRLNSGVKITELKSGKLKEAGLKVGYIIYSIDNTPITNREELRNALKMAESDAVMIRVLTPKGNLAYFAFSLQN